MLKFGEVPYLECSSKGDKRFSALYARIRFRNNRTIEDLYQARKIFHTPEGMVTGLSAREAKGKKASNIEDVRQFYSQLWDEYFYENLDLRRIIGKYRGFSDVFGQEGHACQAEEIYRISKESW